MEQFLHHLKTKADASECNMDSDRQYKLLTNTFKKNPEIPLLFALLSVSYNDVEKRVTSVFNSLHDVKLNGCCSPETYDTYRESHTKPLSGFSLDTIENYHIVGMYIFSDRTNFTPDHLRHIMYLRIALILAAKDVNDTYFFTIDSFKNAIAMSQ